jgi:diguanylate cyclase (GGDEF)-like protein/PAS domain S-box-containing protein
MLGYTVNEMLGMPLLHFMDEEGRRTAEGNLTRRRSGIQEQHEFRCIRKDGTPIWLLVTANPVYDRSGRYAGALAMIADLSVQKAREWALVEAKSELDRRLEELTVAQSLLQAQAYKDALTGLYNRRYFDECIARETERCRRHTRRLCLLFIDIDGFKHINDRWGHSTGDEVLRSIARGLSGPCAGEERALLRSSDVAARFGGDEIVVLAPETDLKGGDVLAARIIARSRSMPTPMVEGTRLLRSISIGVAAFPFHADDPAELIAAADRAMYLAKEAGGGRACLAEGRSRTLP